DQVCRADIVAQVAGVELGSAVGPEVVGRIVGSKALWCHALSDSSETRFYAVINKVDTEETLRAAEDIAESVATHGHGVEAVFLTGEGPSGRGTVLKKLKGAP
ncbi:unnamed protein product, partial [Polarella glacialis]